ncbi:MAG: hypothetical protein K2L33_06215 [Muribaculaceae bacterium]|nr:hypothetical protein [Muribaculaceae bacterium]
MKSSKKIQVLSPEEMKKEIIGLQAESDATNFSGTSGISASGICYNGRVISCEGAKAYSESDEYCNSVTGAQVSALRYVICFNAEGMQTGGGVCDNSILGTSGWGLCSNSGSGSGSGVYAKDPVEACAGHQFQEPCEWMGPLDIDPHRGKCVHSTTTDNRLICSDKA